MLPYVTVLLATTEVDYPPGYSARRPSQRRGRRAATARRGTRARAGGSLLLTMKPRFRSRWPVSSVFLHSCPLCSCDVISLLYVYQAKIG